MKRLAAQLRDSKQADYDPDESGEVVSVGQHHGNSVQIYMAHKVTKLRELQGPSESNQESNIFKGCIFYINGFTDPPIDELRRLISRNGGECLAYRAFKITHFVCNYLTDAQLKHEHAKVKLKNETMIHYVIAAWVTESIQNGKRLNENLYNPAGMSRQHGSNISTAFQNIDKTHYNSNDNNNLIPASSNAVPAHSSTTIDTELTSSQHQFLNFLPIELHHDAILEIQTIRTKKITMKNQIEASSSSLDTINSSNSTTTGSISTGSTTRKILSKENMHRKEALGVIVEHIHYNSDGNHASSKEIGRRMREYVQELIHELSTVFSTTITTSSCCCCCCSSSSSSSSSNNNNNNNNNNTSCSTANTVINNINTNQSQDLFQRTTAPIKQLLIDYGVWLVHENLLEQAHYYAFILRKYCHTHKYNGFIKFCTEILCSIQDFIGNKACII